MPRNANQSKSLNYSLYFNGGSYINLGNSSLGLTANSISIWFKTTSTTSGQQLLSKYGSTYQFQFRLETNGTITLYSFENQSTFATLQSASGFGFKLIGLPIPVELEPYKVVTWLEERA